MRHSSPALHVAFPLTAKTLDACHVNPAFDYSSIHKARHLLYTLRLQGALPSDPPAYPGELAAIGFIGKVYRHLLTERTPLSSPSLWKKFDRYLKGKLGKVAINQFRDKFVAVYPPLERDPGSASRAGGHDPLYFSIILVYLAEANPGITPYHSLFLSGPLLTDPHYHAMKAGLEAFFDHRSTPDLPGSNNLLSFLLSPVREHPESIHDQLQYIIGHWQDLLPSPFLQTLQRGLDHLREDRPGKNPVSIASLRPESFPLPHATQPLDQVRFSQDLDWMSNAIMVAKNTYVWLDQLSHKYDRRITTLDHIPFQELSSLSEWGINALWLIGIWERSPASKMIKQLCGNPDAIPSAYSIFDYTVARDLGGEKAFQRLQEKASQTGIRLAADMVPNHMGVTSKWVLEHPERFLSLDHKPYPGYTYTGPDLSPREDIRIQIEDHYYDRSDAAVVFKRVDHRTGETRYIYHGNDGTAMPWNDTAQLNYLREDVQEGVLDTILDIADKFSIIRFDAAMTLAKKHYQRLWFPSPGEGGAIPTRADHGMSEEEFDAAFPEEFWRRVVDRVTTENPDTLLIAEAFWMMEGYFVRNLGMHRVYNSAFMHMLRDEDNGKFRKLIKNIIAYDPGILKRFVNYMNNPDEETAVAQFGKNGKYFGVCTMMVTLPGLPMFGHGQIEGYQEKYGMEYSKALIPEEADQALIARHSREIFPLFAKRKLFSGVERFNLYDFTTPSGTVDENVFAYSNGDTSSSALVVYHNKWGETEGHLRSENDQSSGSLAADLGLERKEGAYIRFKDISTGREFLRPANALYDHGFPLSLGAYQYHVFYDFQTMDDTFNTDYKKVYLEIGNRGVDNLDYEISKQKYKMAFQMMSELVRQPGAEQPGKFDFSRCIDPANIQNIDPLLPDLYREIFLAAFPDVPPGDSPRADFIPVVRKRLNFIGNRLSPALPDAITEQKTSCHVVIALVLWALLSPLLNEIPPTELRTFLHAFIHSQITKDLPQKADIQKLILSIDILFDKEFPWLLDADAPSAMLERWFANRQLRTYLGINNYQGVEYYHRESFQDWLYLWYSLNLLGFSSPPDEKIKKSLQILSRHYKIIIEASKQSRFQVKALIQATEALED